jgi:hypothetical protein
MAQPVIIVKHKKRKRRVLPKTRRISTPALERKLREAKGARETDCPPDFFTGPLDD